MCIQVTKKAKHNEIQATMLLSSCSLPRHQPNQEVYMEAQSLRNSSYGSSSRSARFQKL